MTEKTIMRRARCDLVERLRATSTELVDAIVAAVRERVPDPVADATPELAAGLPAAVVAVVELCLSAIEAGGVPAGPPPAEAVKQVQRLAPAGVSIKLVWLRYVAGSEQLEDWLAAEVDAMDLPEPQRLVLRSEVIEVQRALLRGLLDGIGDAYMQEIETLTASREQRRAELVRTLLDGGEVSSDQLDYDLDRSHVGAIAKGLAAEDALAEVARLLRCDLLLVSSGRDTVWGWLSDDRPVADEALTRLCAGEGFAGVSIALGAAAHGSDGFRVTHRMARIAQPLVPTTGVRIARFSDAPLAALALADKPIARWFVDTFLGPLDRDANSPALRKTLRTYLELGCASASTAQALHVNRSTVQRHVARIEELLGAAVVHRRAELAIALALEQRFADR